MKVESSIKIMPTPIDMRHPSKAGLLLRAGVLIALLGGFLWWRLPDRMILLRLFGADLRRRLTIPVFTIGTLGVSPFSLLKTVIFLGLLAVVSNGARKILYQRASKTSTLDPQHSYVLARFVSLMIYVVGLMIGLQAAGVSLNSLAILGGTLGIGIGFGLQSIVAN